MDQIRTAKVLEMFIALIGIALLTPIFLPEQNKELKDLVESKYTTATAVYLIRLLEALIGLVIFVGIYILVLQYNNCSFPAMKFFLGTLAEALFMGGLGFFTYSLLDQIAAAYMIPIFYYMTAFGGGRRLLGNFYPFSMLYEGYKEKVYLFVFGILFLILGLIYQSLVKKLRILHLRK